MTKKDKCRVFSMIFLPVLLSVFIVIPCYSSPSAERDARGTEPSLQQFPGGLVEEIRNLTESGVLSSMLQALELIRSRDIGGSEFGRTMTAINSLLIRLVYPDSLARLPVLDLPQTSNYTRIIREAERGVYTRPPDNSDDFFEHILPFLAINEQTRSDMLANVLRDLAKAGELRPNSVFPPYLQGIIHENEGRFSQAEAAYRRAYNISNECYPAMAGVARIRRVNGNISEALAILSDLMVRYPDSIDIKRQLAITYYENRDLERAASLVEEILLSEPRNGNLLLMMVHILIDQGQYHQANTHLDTFASIDPNDRTYLFFRARVQAEGNRNRDSALNYLRSILRTNNNDEEALVYAVGLLMDSNRPADQEEGRELLEQLLRLSDTSVEVLALGLQDAVRRESWQEAQVFLNRLLAVRRTPGDLTNAYYVERGLGNNARALTYARELYERNTSDNDSAAIYISALIDNGRRQEASQLLENRLNSSTGGVKSRFFYLRSRLQSNEETALADLRSSIFEDPRNLDALIAMFEIYHRRREERRAVYYLRQALAISPNNPRLRRYEAEYSALLER